MNIKKITKKIALTQFCVADLHMKEKNNSTDYNWFSTSLLQNDTRWAANNEVLWEKEILS